MLVKVGLDRVVRCLHLLLFFLICLRFSAARKLYAVMFLLALSLELAGTGLGNWTWQTDVPVLGLTTINPPAGAGAFYCLLDLLIVFTVSTAVARRGRRAQVTEP